MKYYVLFPRDSHYLLFELTHGIRQRCQIENTELPIERQSIFSLDVHEYDFPLFLLILKSQANGARGLKSALKLYKIEPWPC
jgi:hypothetical protein